MLARYMLRYLQWNFTKAVGVRELETLKDYCMALLRVDGMFSRFHRAPT